MENKANAQTRASAKWNKKAGYKAKTYKLKEEVVEQFADACESAGVSQAGQLSKMMKCFTKKTVEENYVAEINVMHDKIMRLDSNFSQLKRLMKDIPEGETRQLIEKSTTEIYLAKEQLGKLLKDVYEFYNLIYMSAEE